MTLSSDEAPLTPADRLSGLLATLAECVGTSLDEVCTYGWISGDTFVPFDPDPDDECELDDDEMPCSLAWLRVVGIEPAQESFNMAGDSCTDALSIQLEAGVLRCYEIGEDGVAPTATEMLASAIQSAKDMMDIRCAMLSCEGLEDETLTLGSWTPIGPMGGQYGGAWTATLSF